MAVINTLEDAQFISEKIRDGTLQGDQKEAAFTALSEFRKNIPVVIPLPKKKNFFQRFGEDLERRGEMFTTILEEEFAQDLAMEAATFQIIGKVGAGAVLDFIGEAIVSGGRGLSNITPDFLEDPIKRNATKAGMFFLNTDIGKAGLEAATQGIEKYQEFAGKHPSAARNIESVVNIGILVAPVKATPSARGGFIGRAGRTLEESGTKVSIQNKRDFIVDLVTPKQTVKTKLDQVPRTTESGLFKQSEIALTPAQEASAKEILKLKVSRSKTNQGNFNVIREEVFKEADQLTVQLAKTGKAGRFEQKEFFDALDATLVKLQENPALVGNAEIAAKRIIEIMRKEVAKEKPHVSNLLQARKNFDRRLMDEGREKLFDPNLENAMTFAIREIRKTTNDFINTRVPNVGVKRSLAKQSRLLNAADDIKIKAADDANNAVSRTIRKGLKVLTARGEINQIAALAFGVGGLGAAAMFAPIIRNLGALGVVTYAGVNLVMRPGSRKALGKLLKLMDDMTGKITDPAVLRELRVDRAAIVELLKTAESQDGEQ